MSTTHTDPNIFLLPDLGEGVHEAELISWKVSEGDTVDELQVLAEMETDKALAEVPSPRAGKIKKLHGKVGDIINVGDPLVTFESSDTSGTGTGTEESKISETSDISQAETKPDTDEQRVDAGSVVGDMKAAPNISAAPGKVLATPAVRRLARDLGVDISAVKGSGIGGRVMERDVRTAASGSAATPPVTSQVATTPAATASSFTPQEIQYPPVKVDAAGVSERIPFRGVRRKIADSLSRSVRTAVHFTCVDEADVTSLNKMRGQLAAMTGEKISFLPFVIQAVCHALKQYPTLNANVDDEKAEILIKGVINLGCAVDTDHGLMVPVINNADRLSITELGHEVTRLADACRKRTIDREKLIGGTFTISNVGSYGGMFATPIINYPEVAIIAVGRAKRKVMASNDGAIYTGLSMPLSVSCDHRVVDGAEAVRFLNTVVRFLEHPEMIVNPAGK